VVAKTFSKDAAAKLDWTFDWSIWLPTGDTINGSTWAIDVPGDGALAIAGSPAPSFTTTTTTAWLTGGTLGQKYVLRNRVTTVGGRTEDMSVAIVIEEH
jgi:hypothetical protein